MNRFVLNAVIWLGVLAIILVTNMISYDRGRNTGYNKTMAFHSRIDKSLKQFEVFRSKISVD